MTIKSEGVNPLAGYPMVNKRVLDHFSSRILNDSGPIRSGRREAEGVLLSGPDQTELDDYTSWLSSELDVPIITVGQENIVSHSRPNSILISHNGEERDAPDFINHVTSNSPVILHFREAEHLVPPVDLDSEAHQLYKLKTSNPRTAQVDDSTISNSFREIINGVGREGKPKVALVISTTGPTYISHSSINEQGESLEGSKTLIENHLSSGATRAGRVNQNIFTFHKLHNERVMSKRQEILLAALISIGASSDKSIQGYLDLQELEKVCEELDGKEISHIIRSLEILSQETLTDAVRNKK